MMLANSLKADMQGFVPKASPSYLELVELFPLQSITSKKQYESTLKVIERLIDYVHEKHTVDKGVQTYLTTLSELVEDYEQSHYPAPKINGAEMIKYLMNLQGLRQKDLAKELGGQSVTSNILTGKRELNLKQVRALAKRFKVLPSVFI